MGFKLDPREIGWAPYRDDRRRLRPRYIGARDRDVPQVRLEALSSMARGHFAVSVGPARPAGKGRVRDAPHPRLRVALPASRVCSGFSREQKVSGTSRLNSAAGSRGRGLNPLSASASSEAAIA